MAADAHKEAEKKMSLARERELAAFIMRDVELRRQKAADNGVLAYARRAVPRGRPNERFLQNTLKNLDFANRKTQEDQMWQQYNSSKSAGRHDDNDQQGRSARPVKRGRGDSSYQAASLDTHRNPQSGENGHSPEDGSRSDSRESASPSDSSADASEGGLGPMPGRTIRGRGTTGSKATDVIGPFLVPDNEAERLEYDDERYKKRKPAGPNRPEWLVGETVDDNEEMHLHPNKRLDRMASLLNVFEQKSSGRGKSKKAKKEKKKKSKKRHKEKKRKTSAY